MIAAWSVGGDFGFGTAVNGSIKYSIMVHINGPYKIAIKILFFKITYSFGKITKKKSVKLKTTPK